MLACAEGQANKVVAARQRVTQQTVGKWRARYIEQRLDGLIWLSDAMVPDVSDRKFDTSFVKSLLILINQVNGLAASPSQTSLPKQHIVDREIRL